MVSYTKSRNKDKIEVKLDGRKVEMHPNIRTAVFHVLEYIETIKYIAKHMDLKSEDEKTVSSIIVQSFGDMFKNQAVVFDGVTVSGLVGKVKNITERTTIPRVIDYIKRCSISSEQHVMSASKLILEPALSKLNMSLSGELGG